MKQPPAYVREPLHRAKNKVTLVDLFAGIGGFHFGVGAAAADLGLGVKPLLVSEIEASCQSVYRLNHPNSDDVMNGDVKQIKLGDYVESSDFVTAGFPCQPFSNSGQKRGLRDPRGQFYNQIEKIIKHFKTSAFLLENVPGMTKNGSGSYPSQLSLREGATIGSTMRTLERRMIEGLRDYSIKWLEIDSSQLGSPQVRRRVYIVGLHRDFGALPDLDLPKTQANQFIDIVKEQVIDGLELNPNQELNIRKTMKESGTPSYKDGMRRVGKAYLCAGGNVGQAYHAYGMVPTLTKVWARFLPVYFPHPREELPQLGEREFIPTGGWYGRGHLRRVSVEEAMILQGFPPNFVPHERSSVAYEHAGNAVNALVVKELASKLLTRIVK